MMIANSLSLGKRVLWSVFAALHVSCNNSRVAPPTPASANASPASIVPASPPPPQSQKVARVDTVVLITVDTFRADQPWVGYDKVATPHLTALASRSVIYTKAYALANLTTASLNSLLAIRYASELERDRCTIARYEIPGSLAPTLKASGIATRAAHGHAIFAGNTAPSNGFDEWDLIRGAAGRRQTLGAVTGGDIAERLIRHLSDRHGKKLFIWGHFVDPHHKYVEHAQHRATSVGERRLYDSEVGYTDAVIGRVLDAIEKSGGAHSTAVLVTADHGEAFGEHGFTKHGFSLYEEEIRVPLIIHVPGVAPKRIEVARSSIDIAPTVATLLGVEVPSTWRGKSLTRDFENDAMLEQRPVVVDVPEMQGRAAMRAVLRGRHKVVFSGDSSRVYDLEEDPSESAALSGAEVATIVENARRDLAAIGRTTPSPCRSATSRKILEEAL